MQKDELVPSLRCVHRIPASETVAWLYPISLELPVKAERLCGWDTRAFVGLYITPRRSHVYKMTLSE